MWPYKTGPATFCCSVAILYACSAWCQTAELNGTIQDAVRRTPVPAADVIVRDTTGVRLGHVITGTDGKYSMAGLKRGDQVNAFYSCGGFIPRVGPVPITLSAAAVTHDEFLVHDTDDPGYWAEYAQAVKTGVDGVTTNQEKRYSLYNEYWAALGSNGLSAVAQAQAARQIAAITPPASHSAQMESFATVDLEAVRKADPDIRAAVNGRKELSNKYNIPPDVAAQIAASEMETTDSAASSHTEFIKRFEIIWGSGAKDKINNKLIEHPAVMGFGNIHRMAMQAGGPG
jgi:hypothetical protein